MSYINLKLELKVRVRLLLLNIMPVYTRMSVYIVVTSRLLLIM